MVGTVRPTTPVFFRQVARDLPMNEVLALCVCKWAEIVVLCHADKHSCLVKDRKSKRQVVLADWQITFAVRQLAFLESFAPKPVRIAVIGGASAVTADLQTVPFEDYLACENYYQGFLHTQSMEPWNGEKRQNLRICYYMLLFEQFLFLFFEIFLRDNSFFN